MQRIGAVSDTWPPEETRGRTFEPKAMCEVLDAIVALNEQLLDALGRSARASDSEFPLPKIVRSRIAELSEGQRRQAARCGVLLADGGFSNFARWRQISRLSDHQLLSDECPDWLPSEDSIVLAHAMLTVVWYVVHTAPAAARVLLGMTDEVLTEFRTLGVGNLASTARRSTHWVQPRWRDRVDIWFGIAAHESEAAHTESLSVTLRCLKVTAGRSARLQAFVETCI
jgi:hypothetical protein